MNLAWMFPGQGSQAPGMGRQVIQRYAIARELIDVASQYSGYNLRRICDAGPENLLMNPAVAEPAITATQVVYVCLLQQAGIVPCAVAGYSAGETAAYFAGGVLTAEDAIRVAVIRGSILSRYVSDDSRMISVTRVAKNTIAELTTSEVGLEIAGWNAPDQATLVGSQHAVARASRIVRDRGGMVSDVQVAGPWHSKRMRAVASEIYRAVSDIPFRSPQCKIYSSLTGESVTTRSHWRAQLSLQIARPVRWESIMRHWWTEGVRSVIEVGTGRNLQGILRRNWQRFDEYRVDCVETASGSIAPLERLLNQHASENRKLTTEPNLRGL